MQPVDHAGQRRQRAGAHQWTFDARTGAGINPGNCRLAEYPVRIDGDDILVAVDGVKPLFAAT